MIGTTSAVVNSGIRGDTWLLFQLPPLTSSRQNKRTELLGSLASAGPYAAAMDAATRPSAFSILSSQASQHRQICNAACSSRLDRLPLSLRLPLLAPDVGLRTISSWQCLLRLRNSDLENKPQPPQILADAISREMVAGATHVNVAQEYIVITDDRTYRCLKRIKSNPVTGG